MGLFDVPGRDTCRVKRSRTNTPLQALALLNEVTFVEAARMIGQRMLLEGGPTPETRLTWAYKALLSRRPSAQELAIHMVGLERRLARYNATPEAAQLTERIRLMFGVPMTATVERVTGPEAFGPVGEKHRAVISHITHRAVASERALP